MLTRPNVYEMTLINFIDKTITFLSKETNYLDISLLIVICITLEYEFEMHRLISFSYGG